MFALGCDSTTTFDSLCVELAKHDPTGLAGPVVEHLLGPILVLILMIAAGRVIRGILEHSKAISRDLQVKTLVRNVVTAATYLFAILAALVAGGLNISVLLTFGGLASLAIGLAFQDVLRNLLAGMFLLVEQPFRLGDRIAIGDHAGTVETIQLRTTALRTDDGRLAILPNLIAFNSAIVNESAYPTRQYTVTLRITRAQELEKVLARAREILAGTKEISADPPVTLIPHVDGEAITIDCQYWLDYKSFASEAVGADIARRLAAIAPTEP